MITYPSADFVQKLKQEALVKTRGLPLYEEGPGVDYSKAPHAYALNATLLYDPYGSPEQMRKRGPGSESSILLVERAGGHGQPRTFSGVSGYLNPWTSADPIAETLREELETECHFRRRQFDEIEFYAGRPTVEPRTQVPGAMITVVPILGLCCTRPDVVVNPEELLSYRWVHLPSIRWTSRLAKNYLEVTLPSALAAIGIEGEALARLIG
ncbi:MAG TPA: hypothetical protein VFZ48_01270 [Candidatus Saccharimonadales bacterium]